MLLAVKNDKIFKYLIIEYGVMRVGIVTVVYFVSPLKH
jgi:hypothetical protein